MVHSDTETTPTERSHPPLVIIGASAGGIDAVLTVIGGLPSEFPAPIVIAQHLDPNHESRLADLLAARSNLPIRTVTEEVTLHSGTVYVIPSRRDVEVTDHSIAPVERDTSRSHPSVDRLMSTAASVFRERLIGVILTGAGHDGAAGAQAIKSHGGTVIVQNPDTARYSGMPAAVPPVMVDIVAELEAIAGLLVDLCNGDFGFSSSDEEVGMHRFLDRVREQTGLDFSAYKRPTIERRLHRRMLAVGAADLGGYESYVDRNPDEMQSLVASFLIKVTRFFRDAELYAYLREHVLPTLLDHARQHGELRVWSAGCATGEEAYSLAMLLRDLQAEDADPVAVRIFATDISPEAIEFARHGTYPETAVADLPQDLVERHFLQSDAGYEVRKPVRSMVIFGEHDLSQRAPFPRIDLVLCRNVLIYFTPDLQRRALQLFAFSLRSGGYMVLGKAESVSPLPEFFALDQSPLRVYRRVGGPAPVPTGRILASLAGRNASVAHLRPAVRSTLGRRHDFKRHASPSPHTAQVLDTISTGVIGVERNYHIRSINVAARTLLGVHSAAIGEDLVHQLAPEIAVTLRQAIDRAFDGQRVTLTEHVASDVVDSRGRDFIITCSPEIYDHDGSETDIVVLEVVDVTAMAQHQRDLASERDRLREERDELGDRRTRAVAEIQKLRAADRTMAIEQGRLRAENEQLQLASEEAQAAAEEIETLNEEQQATNEELETLNEELQATVEELTTTNADLQARTIELESLTTAIEHQRNENARERTRLHTMLEHMSDAVLVLSRSGEAELSNPAWDRLLGPLENLAPQDEHGMLLSQSSWSRQHLLDDAPFTTEFTLPGPDGTRRWFEASVQPIPVDGDRGAVVVARDITDRNQRSLQERFLAIASHELRTPMTTLSGAIQLLARRLERTSVDEMLLRQARRAHVHYRQLERLIDELTDITRLRAGKFHIELEPVDLRDVTRSAVDIATDAVDGVELRLDLPNAPVSVLGDPVRLEQVVLNLLTNAFRHARESDRVDLRLRRDGDAAVIEVQDYGPGIAADAHDEIFSEFQQAGENTRGLGLGLYISRQITTAHSGTIDVDSVVGEGSTFRIGLPLWNGPDATSEPLATGAPQEES